MPLKVLTVDDSKTIRMIVKKAFKPFDCLISEAENGVEGLAFAAKEKPDLIVLDITMPVMNGIEMLTKLKEDPVLKEVPVIMLTAESGKDNVLKIVKMGVNDYVVKPFKGEQLIERAKAIVSLEPKKEESRVNDSAKQYFPKDGDIQRLVIPGKADRPVIADIEGHLDPKIKEMADSGMQKFVLDLSQVGGINVSLVKLIITMKEKFQKQDIRMRIVAPSDVGKELKEFQETSEIAVDESIEQASQAF